VCFTFYRAGEKRGDIPRNLKGGVVVHDHFKPYNTLVEIYHAFCNAHILRELEALIEFEKVTRRNYRINWGRAFVGGVERERGR
jgi:hypothetical protein